MSDPVGCCPECNQHWRKHEGPIKMCNRLTIIRRAMELIDQKKLSPREAMRTIKAALKSDG